MGNKKKSGLVLGILIGIIIMLIIVCVLFATNTISLSSNTRSNNNKTGNTEDNIYNTEQKDDENDNVNDQKYLVVIEEYRNAMKDNEYDFTSDKYPNINNNMMHFYHNYLEGYYQGTMSFNYTYYDINKDGKEELIVVTNTDTKSYNIAEIYTYDGTKPVKFIDDICLGERCSASIYDNGIIYFYGAGGAMRHGLSFYKIDKDGYSMDVFKAYAVEIDDNKNVIITDGMSNAKTDFTSDGQVISNVVGSANKVDLSKLEWKDIK